MTTSIEYITFVVSILLIIVLAYNYFKENMTNAAVRVQRSKPARRKKAAPVPAPSADGVEQSIIDSHREFVEEAYQYAHGANATDVEMDHATDINPRVGLRQIDYSGVFLDPDARVQPSEDASQIARKTGTYTI